MLKVKHALDFIPLMKDEMRIQVSSEEENQRLIAKHFQALLGEVVHEGLSMRLDEVEYNYE